MSFSLSQSLDLPEELQEVLARYVEQITQEWTADLRGLVLFGSAARGDFVMGRSNMNVLLVIRNLSIELLQRAARLHRQWGKHQIVAPLLMTEDDLVRSGRFFPLEFLQMIQSHVVLAGRDPFGEYSIDSVRLGWQCEQELMANLLRLRQRFIEGEGRIEAIEALLILSITAVLPCIRGLLYCLGHSSKEKDGEMLERLLITLQFDPTIFLEVLSIKRGGRSPGSFEWPKVYDRYVQNLERFSKHIQDIRQEGP